MIEHSDIDILNGAISGGIAKTLNAELDYLVPRMKELPNVNFATDWKLITLQIGSKFHYHSFLLRHSCCLYETNFN